MGNGAEVLAAASAFEDAGVAAVVYTHVDTDGAMAGPDLDGLRRVAAAVDLPVIASGGVASLDDVRAVAALAPGRIAGAIVGRALYEGKFTLQEAMRLMGDMNRLDELERELIQAIRSNDVSNIDSDEIGRLLGEAFVDLAGA